MLELIVLDEFLFGHCFCNNNKERNYLIVIILKRAIKVLGNLLSLSLILSWYF